MYLIRIRWTMSAMPGGWSVKGPTTADCGCATIGILAARGHRGNILCRSGKLGVEVVVDLLVPTLWIWPKGLLYFVS
jgi:hypothetical protein